MSEENGGGYLWLSLPLPLTRAPGPFSPKRLRESQTYTDTQLPQEKRLANYILYLGLNIRGSRRRTG